MTSEQAYLAAALPEPVTLLHQPLEPYSLGHELLLRRFRSPFLCESPYEAAELKGKLFTAVYICANRYDEAVAGLRSPTLAKDFEKWRRLCGEFDLHKITVSFLEYIKAGRACPEFSSRPGRSARPGAPFLLLLQQILTGHLGFTRAESLNCPFGLARWHFCAYFEGKGALSIRNPKELDALRAKMRELGLQPIRVQRN